MSKELMLRNIERAQRAIDENRETVKMGGCVSAIISWVRLDGSMTRTG